MIRHPLSSRSGLTSQGTLLLVLLGLGAAGFLIFLLPRLTTSRAAEPRSRALAAPAEDSPAEVEEPEVELAPIVNLVEEDEDEPVPAAAELAAVADAAPGTDEEQALAAETPKMEGPKLKHVKGGGRTEIKQSELKAERRARRQKQRESGEAPAGTDTQNARPRKDGPGRDRSRPDRSQRPPRQEKPAEEAQDGP